MTIDMKNDKIHCTCDNIYNALEMKERNIKFLNICKGIKENNKHRIFSLPCCRFQVSLFSIWNNTTCFIVKIVTNSNFKFSNPRISRFFSSVLTSSRYRRLPVCCYTNYFELFNWKRLYSYTCTLYYKLCSIHCASVEAIYCPIFI